MVLLGLDELREVATIAVACALTIFERACHDDRRPRAALEAAQAFADGGRRGKSLRDTAWTSGSSASVIAAYRTLRSRRGRRRAAGGDHERPRTP